MTIDGLFNALLAVKYRTWDRKYDKVIFLPPICYASRLLGELAKCVFIHDAAWVVRDINARRFLEKFLESLPNDKGLMAVRRVCFTSFHRYRGITIYGPNQDLALMARCKGLHRVLFTFHVDVLMKVTDTENGSTDDGFPCKLKSTDDILAFHELEKIFNCQDREKILFDGITDNRMVDRFSGGPLAHLETLGG
ncbi:hypothetical protein P154DRAFT_528126 [Amniculicola lignicola CBS 123094]|uniref:Uncharacterized protein n=1 Tax=Amniculicola lignicola CBS 123094 TaxID=1392246 RepID=A0A6A5VVC3_9PLEO|nr:hypothetical protein P154DRAFT_528126 [Amniculicola lignicola CBS 123094]